jgi:hypothetical protein
MSVQAVHAIGYTPPKVVFKKRAVIPVSIPEIVFPEATYFIAAPIKNVSPFTSKNISISLLNHRKKIETSTTFYETPEAETIPVVKLKKLKPMAQTEKMVMLCKPVEVPMFSSSISVDTLPKVLLSKMALRRADKLFVIQWNVENPKKRTKFPSMKIPPREKTDTVRTIVTYKTDTPVPVKKVFKPQPGGVKIALSESKEDKLTEFTMTKELSKETTLQVYFTNGKGKFFQTSPRLLLVDPVTKATVFKFFRTVDANGNPDLINVPPGNYDLRFESNPSLVSQNVSITKDNNQKMVITVHNCGLQFRYEDNERRPVKEFTASVKRVFDNSHAIVSILIWILTGYLRLIFQRMALPSSTL